MILLIVSFIIIFQGCNTNTSKPVKIIESEGNEFRDLNKNGVLDPYEDWRIFADQRTDDLISKMSLEEKVGLMFPVILDIGENGELIEKERLGNHIRTSEAILDRKINHIYIYSAARPQTIAKWSNHIQELAEHTTLGIPVTVCSDPKHSVNKPYIISNYHTPGFSQWPDPIGLAATRDTALVYQFASIAAREYRAVGIHSACHPMADLATEPR